LGKFDAERHNEPKRPQVKKTPRQLEQTKQKAGLNDLNAEKKQNLNLLTKVLKKQNAPRPPQSAVPKPSKKDTKKASKKEKAKKRKKMGDGDTELDLDKSVNKQVQQQKIKKGGKKGGKKDRNALITREYTINFGKKLFNVTLKKRAPRALKILKHFAYREFKNKDVRVAVGLNQHVWSQGIRNPPRRVRFRLSRKRNEDNAEEKQKFYTLITHVPLTKEDFHGKGTTVITEQ